MFPITLSQDKDVPLYRQLCDALREAIVSGRLKVGQQLPSQRDLAEYLDLGRNTVLRSYDELLSQGYLQSATGMGTFVSDNIPNIVKKTTQSAHISNSGDESFLSRYGQWLLQDETQDLNPTECAEVNYGACPADQLPIRQWRQILLKQCREHDISKISYVTEPFGYPPLREAIASYLRRARAVNCDAEQVVLFNGTQHALNVLSRVLIDADDLIGVENPGFCDARHSFLAQRARLYPVSVDEKGIVTDELLPLTERLKILHITPCHQDPTGVSLSSDRRPVLLDWARRTGAC